MKQIKSPKDIGLSLWEGKAGCSFTCTKTKFHWVFKTEYGDEFSVLNTKFKKEFVETMYSVVLIIQQMNALKNKHTDIIIGINRG
jgi:hypothetical protein